MEPLAIGFSKRCFHHIFSVLPQPDGQLIILGRDFMCKSGMGITNILINYPEEPLPCPKDHNITRHQYQRLVKAVKEHICKCILKAIEKYFQENEALLTGPSCTLLKAVLYLNTGDYPPVFHYQYPSHHLMLIIDLQVAKWLHTSIMLTPLDSPWNSSLTIIPKKDADSNVTQ